MRVLNTCAASGAAGSALSVTSSPSFFAVRGTAVGGSDACSEHGQQLVEPDARLRRDADDRRQRALPHRLGSTAARSSSFDGISPSKYFSITASSTSMIDSIDRFAELASDRSARRPCPSARRAC